MITQKVHVIAQDDIILLFGLLGIEGTIINSPNDFLKEFQDLIKITSISMIIIAIDLPNDIINYIANFKLTHRRPFVFYIPDIFERNIVNQDVFQNEIIKLISKIIN